MAFPVAALMSAGTAGSGIVSSVYTFAREFMASRENSRYWADYQRNTGVTVRYPFRTGYYYDYSRMLGAVNSGFKSANWGYGQYSGGYRAGGGNDYDYYMYG